MFLGFYVDTCSISWCVDLRRGVSHPVLRLNDRKKVIPIFQGFTEQPGLVVAFVL